MGAKLEQALAVSVVEHRRLAAEKQNQEALLIEHMKKAHISEKAFGLGGEAPAPVQVPDAKEEIDPDDLARRTAFLRAQRDKLLAMKKMEREKMLAEAEASTAKERPKSARAARSAMRSGRQTIDPRNLEARKALAAKLMQEVILQEE